MNNLFLELTLILTLAGLVAFLVSLLKQPSIIGYILTGLIVGPFGYLRLHQGEVFSGMSQIGITLLLFMVGLELDITQLKRIGKTAVYTGLGQIFFTSFFGFIILKLLHFSTLASLYIAPALTFASTIIIVKLLSEKKDLQSLYGKIVVGLFLIQDFVAIVILLFLSSLSHGAGNAYSSLPLWQNVSFTLIRMLCLLLLTAWLSNKVFPKIVSRIGRSEELMLLFSLAWVLGLAAFVSMPAIGFSLEIGGFLAGLALARSALHYEISAKIKPLRDFFIIIFFIVLGSSLAVSNLQNLGKPALVLSLFVLIGNPLIVMLLLAVQGYKPRTGFFAGVTVAQISEFSLILVAVGQKLGHLNQSEVGLVTLVGIITIALSSYLILYAGKLYDWLKPRLQFLDFKKGRAEKNLDTTILKNHIILVGAHRLGRHLVEVLQRQNIPFVIVDFNPEVVESFLQQGLTAVCGDITDEYILQQINLPTAKIIISTVPDFNDNIALIAAIKQATFNLKTRPKLIFIAQDEEETKYLYGQDIDYVISPHFMGSMHLAKILGGRNISASLKKLKEHHLSMIGR